MRRNSTDTQRGWRNRTLDLVLQRLRDPIRPNDPFFDDLNVELLFNDHMIIAAGGQTRWARRRKIELAELIGEPWILAPPDTMNYRAITDAYRALGLPVPKIALKTLSTHLRANLVGSGKFIAPFPHSVFSWLLRRTLFIKSASGSRCHYGPGRWSS